MSPQTTAVHFGPTQQMLPKEDCFFTHIQKECHLKKILNTISTLLTSGFLTRHAAIVFLECLKELPSCLHQTWEEHPTQTADVQGCRPLKLQLSYVVLDYCTSIFQKKVTSLKYKVDKGYIITTALLFHHFK